MGGCQAAEKKKGAGARHVKKNSFGWAQLLDRSKRDKNIGDDPSGRDRTNLSVAVKEWGYGVQGSKYGVWRAVRGTGCTVRKKNKKINLETKNTKQIRKTTKETHGNAWKTHGKHRKTKRNNKGKNSGNKQV